MLHLGLFCQKLSNTTELLSQLEQHAEAEKACASQGVDVVTTADSPWRSRKGQKAVHSKGRKGHFRVQNMMQSVLADVAATMQAQKPAQPQFNARALHIEHYRTSSGIGALCSAPGSFRALCNGQTVDPRERFELVQP